MATEIKKVLEVDTGESTKSIKQLRDEIKRLKTEYESAEIGSEKFERASNDLAIAQADLKTALVDGKKATDNAEGSYNHLAATMAELKKQWKATADEVKRNELGKQIDSINDKLKGMDSSIGNNQRLVGSYAEEFKKALNEQQDATIVTKTKLESLQKVTSGLASGYAALQGVTALLGIENENLEKTFVKVQSAMAIAQGVGGLKDLVEGLGSAKVAFGDTTKGTKAFITGLSGVRKAVIATGIGALVVAVGALIANWEKLNDLFSNTSAIDRARKATREYNAEIRKLANESSTKNILRVKELSLAYTSLGDNLNDKRKFVTEYKDELKQMGIQMNNVNDADKVFITQTEDYIKALTLRAKADATREYASKKYNEYLDKIGDKEKALAETFDVIQQSPNNMWGYGLTMEQLDYKDASTISREYGVLPAIASNFKNLRSEIKTLKKEAEIVYEDILKDAIAFENESKRLLSDGTTKVTAAEETAEKITEIRDELYLNSLSNEEKEIELCKREYAQKLLIVSGHTELVTALEIAKQEAIAAIRKKYAEKEQAEAKKQAEEWAKIYNSAQPNSSDMGDVAYKMGEKEFTNDGSIDGLKTDISINDSNYRLRLDNLEVFKNEELITEERYNELKLKAQKEYNNKSADLIGKLSEKEEEAAKTRKDNIVNAFTGALSAASAIISEIQAGIDIKTEKEFERNKKLQIANTIISVASGIINAISTSMGLPQPFGAIMAGINSAAVAGAGIVQINNIKKTTFDSDNTPNLGGLNTSSSPAAVPNITTSVPMTQVRNIQTDAEIAEMNKAQKVYVLESDITTAQKRVEVRENNASF